MNQRFMENRDGIKLYLQTDRIENPRGIVVIVHGLCEHCGRYDYVTERLNTAGYSIYRFDHRGHGRRSAQGPLSYERGHTGSDQLLPAHGHDRRHVPWRKALPGPGRSLLQSGR